MSVDSRARLTAVCNMFLSPVTITCLSLFAQEYRTQSVIDSMDRPYFVQIHVYGYL